MSRQDANAAFARTSFLYGGNADYIDALYAAYRMARLGIIVMDLCRPIPFQQNDVPSVASLVSNVVRRRAEAQSD